MPDWSSITRQLEDAGLSVAENVRPDPIAGGDISAAWRLRVPGGDVFLKTGRIESIDMFTAEAEGLAEIASARVLPVPAVHAVGQSADVAFLALEWLSFDQPNASVERDFGKRLANMHRVTADEFGWHRDNTIGLTPQINTRSGDWIAFFQEHRLGYQLRLAADNGHTGELQQQGDRLLKRLPSFFDDYDPVPSLLHGDLWGGNWASSGGEPVIFDPAVYFGDRETDLAMTKLFGGFGHGFYEAYESAWPLAPGSRERLKVYQLYHVLNHLNLFGCSYLGRALALTSALL
ncbi:MAG: fructosamine kinase family protein [Woeseiaceae bacterium]